jgi:hypothetical protein
MRHLQRTLPFLATLAALALLVGIFGFGALLRLVAVLALAVTIAAVAERREWRIPETYAGDALRVVATVVPLVLLGWILRGAVSHGLLSIAGLWLAGGLLIALPRRAWLRRAA